MFWLPLAGTWLMMSAEGPFLSAVIARMAEPKYNLAAYGVTFSMALIAGAPAFMIMAAATTLSRDRHSLIRVRRFTFGLVGIITSLMVVLVIPSIFFFIAQDLIHLPKDVARLTHRACIIMIPWPGAVGYRRFYQGVLIRHHLTRHVAYGTAIRLSSMALTALILYFGFRLEGASVGAASLTAGVLMEAAASRLMAGRVIKGVLQEQESRGPLLGYGAIIGFYLPLALTTIIGLGIRPMVTFFVGQSRMAIESLAVLPVVQALIFLFACLGFSYQEVVIALVGNGRGNYQRLRNFALTLGLAILLGLGLIGLTPLSGIWFRGVSGLSDQLASFAALPTKILIPLPALTLLLCFQRAILMNARRTAPITWSTVAEGAVVMASIFVLIGYLDAVGAVAAAAALLMGGLASTLFLFHPFLKVFKSDQ
jgi:hypothetical protein